MNSGPPRLEFQALTGLRGVAALWVVSVHYMGDFTLCFPASEKLAFLLGKGHLGVDIFFILSGFILCHVYRPMENKPNGENFPRFLLYRLARIYPAHFFTLLLLVVMVGVAKWLGIQMEGQYEIGMLLPNLTMTHAWPGIERIHEGAGWNYPSWSVSAEWFAYLLVFPASYYSLRFAQLWKIPHGLLCYLYLAALWTAYLFRWIPWPTAALMVSMEFLAGCHLYYAFLTIRNSRFKNLQSIFSLMVIALLVSTYFLHDGLSRTLLYFSVPLLLVGLAEEKNPVAHLLATPLFRWFGLISYSIYMSHAVVQKLLVFLERKWAIEQAPLLTRSLFFLFIIVALLAASSALYYLVEEPSRRWVRKRFFLKA